MLYILWSILNIGLFIYFIVICFRATKWIREKWGFLTALFFVFGFLSFVSHESEKQDQFNHPKTNGNYYIFHPKDHLEINSEHMHDAKLFVTPFFDLYLNINIAKDSTTKENVVTVANVSTEGLVGSHVWQTKDMRFDVNTNGNIHYSIAGALQWQLFGKAIFSENKIFEGNIDENKK